MGEEKKMGVKGFKGLKKGKQAYIVFQVIAIGIVAIYIFVIVFSTILEEVTFDAKDPVIIGIGTLIPIFALTIDLKEVDRVPKVLGYISLIFGALTAFCFLGLAVTLTSNPELTWKQFVTESSIKLITTILAGLGFNLAK